MQENKKFNAVFKVVAFERYWHKSAIQRLYREESYVVTIILLFIVLWLYASDSVYRKGPQHPAVAYPHAICLLSLYQKWQFLKGQSEYQSTVLFKYLTISGNVRCYGMHYWWQFCLLTRCCTGALSIQYNPTLQLLQWKTISIPQHFGPIRLQSLTPLNMRFRLQILIQQYELQINKIIKQLFIAHFLSNISAKNYQSIICVKVAALQMCEILFETSVYRSESINDYERWHYTHSSVWSINGMKVTEQKYFLSCRTINLIHCQKYTDEYLVIIRCCNVLHVLLLHTVVQIWCENGTKHS